MSASVPSYEEVDDAVLQGSHPFRCGDEGLSFPGPSLLTVGLDTAIYRIFTPSLMFPLADSICSYLSFIFIVTRNLPNPPHTRAPAPRGYGFMQHSGTTDVSLWLASVFSYSTPPRSHITSTCRVYVVHSNPPYYPLRLYGSDRGRQLPVRVGPVGGRPPHQTPGKLSEDCHMRVHVANGGA